MESTSISHTDIRSFAENHVNLPSADARRYRQQVDYLRDNLARHIADNPGFGLVKMLHAGSVAKGTALRNINDLDVAVYVKKDQAPVGEKYVVPWVGERLCEVYPQKDRGDFTNSPHCVTVHFHQSGLDVDVVPVIYEGDKDDYGYLIDKDTGDGLLTSIPHHLQFIRKRKGSDPDFAQIVRLAKWWAKRQKDMNPAFKCKSFLLELLVAHLADSGASLKNYPEALKALFNYVVKTGLERRVAFDDYYPATDLPDPTGDFIEVFDPVNPKNNVTHRYSKDDRDALVEAAGEAADAIREAHYSTTKQRAVESWQTVLGPSFRR